MGTDTAVTVGEDPEADELAGLIPTEDLLAIIREQTVAIEAAEAGRRRVIDVAKRTGTSWAAIGRACGISRQAVTQRYGRRA